MSLLKNILGGQETETETELREFTNQRQYEREVFESALKEWLLQSGLGPIMMDQMEEFAHQAGLDGWPDQFEMYDREFNPRYPQHKEILDHIHDRVDEARAEDRPLTLDSETLNADGVSTPEDWKREDE